jgi:putative aldouronate transport system substrate-binding protein
MERIAGFALAVVLLTAGGGAFAAGSTESGAAQLAPVTYVYYGQSSPEQIKYREEDLAPVLARDLGITLKYVDIPPDQYFQKLFLMLAGGEGVDWFWAPIGQMESMVNKDFLLPLNDLLDKYGADIYRVVTKKNFRKFTFNGVIYAAASRNMVRPTPNSFVTYRGDLREAVGITKPLASLEDLESYFQKVEQKFPGKARWIVTANAIMMTARAWDPHAGMFQTGNIMSPVYLKLNEKDDKVYPTWESDIFRNHCRFMEGLRKQGFIHEDTLSKNIGDTQGFYTGVSIIRQGAGGNRAYEQLPGLRKYFPDAWIEDDILYPEKTRYIDGTAGAAWCIYSRAPQPEKAMQLINWLYKSQETNDLWTWGVEGKHYKLNKDGTVDMLTKAEMNFTWETQVQDYFRYPNILRPEVLQRVRTSHIGAEISKAYNWAYQLTDVESEYTALQTIDLELIQPMGAGFIPYDEGMPQLRKRMEEARFDRILASFQRQFTKFYAESK